MNITSFYADVRNAIGRGPALDAVLPGWAAETLSDLENGHTFVWQRRAVSFPLVAGANSNVVALAAPLLKAINWVKFGITQGVGSQQTTLYGKPLAFVDPAQIVSIDLGYATACYLDGLGNLVLDALPQEACTLFVDHWVYTDWAGLDPDDDDDTPPILVRHYAAFKAAFMMTAAANLRDGERLGAIWSGLNDRRYAAMIAADTDLEWKGRKQLRMGYNQPNAPGT